MKGLALLAFCVAAVSALYEDHTGSVDWHRRFLGAVDFVALDGATPQGCKRLLAASGSGVVASIDSESGEILWRHVYEREGEVDAVLRSKWGLVTVSGGGRLVRSWETSSGSLRWESPTGLEGEASSYPLATEWRPGGVVATLSGSSVEILVVAVGTEVVGFKGRSGDQIWKARLPHKSSDTLISFIRSSSDDSTIHILSTSLQTKTVFISRLTTLTGAIDKEAELPAPWLVAMETTCVVVGGVALCLDPESHTLYHGSGDRFLRTDLETLGVNGVKLLQAGGDGETFWLHSDHTHWLLGLHDNHIAVVTKTGDLFSYEAALSAGGESVRVGVRWEDGEGGSWVQLVTSGEDELSDSVMMKEPRGKPVQGDLCVSQSKKKNGMFQLAFLMEDSSIVMVTSPGEVAWVREDGLGSVVAMEAVDLPPADQSGSIANFITSTKYEGNPLKLALLRLRLQFSLAKEFIRDLQNRGLPTLLVADDDDDLIRDQFNVRKLLVVATETGKLYGLDSNTGGVVWQRFIPNIAPLSDGTLSLHVLRTASHPPLPPLSVAIGVSKDESFCEGEQVMMPFNPLTGGHVTLDGDHVMSGDGHMICLGPVIQMMVLPQLDHTHSHVLLYLTRDMQVHTFPSSAESLRHALSVSDSFQLFLFAADMESGLLTGYHLERNVDELIATEAWQIFYPPDFESIDLISTRSKLERVGSPGRVRADRSVQYKYLNPHLFAVVTSGHDDTAGEMKSFFSVYLVDGVTGATIHHTTHRNAVGPVNFVLSENWIVYHYYNTKSRRHELAVTELYDQPSNHTHSVWSSLSPPSLPIITSQAYIFPPYIAAMATTQTKKGLTHKSLIMGLHSGHIVSLPKRVLDPRRELLPTDDMREDGLPKYDPVMILRPVTYINYNRTVSRLRRVDVATTGLESTCLILASGLDLFFTRVTPSKQFDLLAEDFDFMLIATVVMGLVAGTIGLAYLAKRKSLRSLWK